MLVSRQPHSNIWAQSQTANTIHGPLSEYGRNKLEENAVFSLFTCDFSNVLSVERYCFSLQFNPYFDAKP